MEEKKSSEMQPVKNPSAASEKVPESGKKSPGNMFILETAIIWVAVVLAVVVVIFITCGNAIERSVTKFVIINNPKYLPRDTHSGQLCPHEIDRERERERDDARLHDNADWGMHK